MVNMGKQITLAELGRVLGLDKSSISLALRGSPRVSENTRARVQAAARKYGYKPNLAARQLRNSGPQSVSLVMPAGMEPLAHSEPVSTIRHLTDLVARNGLLFTIVSGPGLESVLSGRSGYPLLPDGVFIWGDVSAGMADACAQRDIAHVALDPNHPSYATYTGPLVRIDNRAGAAALTRHLLERGAQRLFFVQTTSRHLSHDDRHQAARQEWLAARSTQGLTFCYLDELKDEDLRQFATEPHGAIQCSNDEGAVRVWHRLARMGFQVPERVLLAGFDGDELGRLIGLTTAVFDAASLAETGWNLLHQLMAETDESADPGPQRTVPVALRVGRTT